MPARTSAARIMAEFRDYDREVSKSLLRARRSVARSLDALDKAMADGAGPRRRRKRAQTK